MTKDEALNAAARERDRTKIPQLVGMNSSGQWSVIALTGRKLTDVEDTERAWARYEIDEAIARRNEGG